MEQFNSCVFWIIICIGSLLELSDDTQFSFSHEEVLLREILSKDFAVDAIKWLNDWWLACLRFSLLSLFLTSIGARFTNDAIFDHLFPIFVCISIIILSSLVVHSPFRSLLFN